MIKTVSFTVFLSSLVCLPLSALAGPLNGNNNGIIDPPRAANTIQDPSDGVYGYPPGAPIQPRVMDPSEGVYGYPPGAPIQPTIQAEEPTKPDFDSPPPVKGVIGVRRAAEVLASLNPDIQLKVQETTLLAGAALTLATITRAFIVARTRSPQMAYAMIPPVSLSDGEGSYLVPPQKNDLYTPEEALALANYLNSLSDEDFNFEYENTDPELLDYMEEVAAAVSIAAYQHYVRACPNPDLCV